MSYRPGRSYDHIRETFEFRSGFLNHSVTEYRAHPAPEKSSDPLTNVQREVSHANQVAQSNLNSVSDALAAAEKQRTEEREKHATEVSTLERRVAELEEALRTVQRLSPYDAGVKLIISGVGVAV
jgi:TPP-dependent pyruvate/acetoin dehydrogenase alpha subunit